MTLYRTHRPQRFADIVGQPAVASTLQNALHKGRVSHAFLFAGPRGTGKTSTARIFARCLCCESPVITDTDGSVSYEACDACRSCLLMKDGHTADFIELDAASNRGIEDIREMREQVAYPPTQLSRKVYLIDEVHMLTTEAFNALLKTLEEPPPHCLFILATTELHKVPLTIRSRCQLVRFERGSQEHIQEKLDRIVAKEGMQVEEGVTALLAAQAEGGFRDAETLLESLAAAQPLRVQDVLNALGLPEKESIVTMVDLLLAGDSASLGRQLASLRASSSLRPESLIRGLIEELRQRIYAKPTLASDPIAAYALSQLLEAYVLHKSSPDGFLPLEIACLSICSMQKNVPSVDGQGIFFEPSVQEENYLPEPIKQVTVQAEPVSAPSSESVPVVEIRDKPTQDVRKAWKQVADEVAAQNLVLGQSLKDTVLHTAEDGAITVHVRFKFHADKLAEKKNAALILEALLRITGRSWAISYVVTGTVSRRPSAKTLPDVAAVFGQTNS